MELQGALGSCIAETESKFHHDQWKKQNIDFLQTVRKNLVAAGEEAQRQENELQDRRISSVTAAMGSMLHLKPITMRFSQVFLPFPIQSRVYLLTYFLVVFSLCNFCRYICRNLPDILCLNDLYISIPTC